MKKSHVLRLLISSVVTITTLLTILAGTASAAPVRSTTVSAGINVSKLIGALPLWKYAQKISSSKSPSLQIPPCLVSTTSPRCYSPQQIRNTYDIQPLLDNGITGKGHTIVLIEASTSSTLAADVHLYDQLYGLKDPTIKVISPFGPAPYSSGWYPETALDVEIAHALAPDANIDLVVNDITTAQSDAGALGKLLAATKYAVDQNLGDVISQSFGIGETCVGSAYLQEQHLIFSAARAKHITVLASAGDSGAAQAVCVGGLPTLGLAVSVPASDSLVTSVGGTSLDASVKKGKYIRETTWNEWNAGGGATGGGFSTIYARPKYQDGVSGAGSTRGVPDIAFDGDPFTGVPVVFSQSGTTFIVPIGGTSVGSPAWAGIVVLANQYAGKRLGFLNSALYRILRSDSFSDGFHDITTGNNTVNTFDNQGNPIPIKGYNAASGWDAVTGIGTPKVSGLAPLLAQYVKSDDGQGL